MKLFKIQVRRSQSAHFVYEISQLQITVIVIVTIANIIAIVYFVL
jgi:hypothetical protein